MKVLRHPAALLACLAVAVTALAGCAIDGSDEAAGKPTVSVTERDFRISAPGKLPAGEVDLSVTNRGPDAHELIVVRKHTRRLPIRSDGLTVDEDKIESDEVGVMEPADPGVRRMSFRLTPGTYELFCNMAGHYKGGMHRKLVVH
jgi:uncharacterized cupredoxin-like copper-binding protein